ncbi:MAG TPA: N-acyl homoserine lactonase family protein [Candidatus Elarobacter sp.]|nr:N-acyl homoserine lactonase family protein [Candidatus Elarobacter sp.]
MHLALSITPVRVGAREAESSLFLYLTDAGRPIEIEYRLWVIRGGGRTIVVDTGLPLDEARRRGITVAVDAGEALRAAGIDPQAVDTVILTHLHWDHGSNVGAFPNAQVVVQRAEIDWLREPMQRHPSIGRFYSDDLSAFTTLAEQGRLRLLDGDAAVADGVAVWHVGGHTPGSQMVVVDVDGGRAVICGDAIPLNRNFTDDIPTSIHGDVRDAIRAMERVRALAPLRIYTGHDPEAQLDLAAPALAG